MKVASASVLALGLLSIAPMPAPVALAHVVTIRPWSSTESDADTGVLTMKRGVPPPGTGIS